MSEQSVILMVEDEPEVLRINARMMARRGYEVLCAETCAKARALLAQRTPDLLILDIMLPDGSGYDLCQSFRAVSDHPVIFLTGKNEVADRVDGLSQGGDYYLTKPCSLDELLAVTERLLQRQREALQKQAELTALTRGTLSLDLPRARAEVRGRDAGLTVKEFALLLALVQSGGRAVSPGELYETVWGLSAGKDVRTVRTHITNLRRKLDADNAADFDIVSVYGKGYAFLFNG